MYCSNCGTKFKDESKFCSNCGTEVRRISDASAVVHSNPVTHDSHLTHTPPAEPHAAIVVPITPKIYPSPAVGADFDSVIAQLEDSRQFRVRSRLFTRLTWFILANAAVVVSVSVISAGTIVGLMPILIVFSCLFPFVTLLFSRWMAKRSHGIVIVDESTNDERARALHALVTQLSHRAGLKRVPQVGIYRDADLNAFATGPSRKRSLVAFSSALVEQMEDRHIAAVAAHEIAHIANGDMVTITLVQSVVNTLINVITVPLSVIKWIALFDENVGNAVYWMVSLIKFVLTLLLVFLGSLVVKAFSRHREFKADALGAKLFDRNAMIGALRVLDSDEVKVPRRLEGYTALKINGPKRWLDLLSTHPATSRRIKALQKLQLNEGSPGVIRSLHS